MGLHVRVRTVSLLFLAEVRNREPFLDASGGGSPLICWTRYAMQKHNLLPGETLHYAPYWKMHSLH